MQAYRKFGRIAIAMMAVVLSLVVARPCTAQLAADLGVLAHFTNSVALRVNSSGMMIGYCYNEAYDAGMDYWYPTSSRAVVWVRGNPFPTALPLLPGYRDSIAVDLNDNGQIGGQCDNGVFNQPQACRWERINGVWWVAGLGYLPNTSHNTSEAFEINSAGEIIGESGLSGTEDRAFFIWRNGMMAPVTGLPDGPNGPSVTLSPARPHGLSDYGLVVGVALAEGGAPNGGVIWDSATKTTLAYLPNAEPMAISPSGLVAGYDYHVDAFGDRIENDKFLFLWDNGVETDLARPDPIWPDPSWQWMDQDIYPRTVTDEGRILFYGYTYWDVDWDGVIDSDYTTSGTWIWNGYFLDLATQFFGVTGSIDTACMDSLGDVAFTVLSPDGTTATSYFLWRDTGPAQALTSLGGNWSYVWDITDFGYVVGESTTSGTSPKHASVWGMAVSTLGVSDAAVTRKGRTVTVTFEISNPSTSAAENVTVSTATLGAASSTSIPLSLRTIRPDTTKRCTLKFTVSDVPSGSTMLTIVGTSTLGYFYRDQTVIVP